jgi:group I intron endonuclease
MKSGIYKITNISNAKMYIGSAANLGRREKQHFQTLERGVHRNVHLQSSYNKYGPSKFVFDVIEYCEVSMLLEREQYYLDLYTPTKIDIGYNMCSNAERSQLGRKRTPEQIKRISESHKGIFPTAETRLKLSKIRKGRVFTPEHREKIRIGNIGKKLSDEQKRIISEHNKKRKLSESHKKAFLEGAKKSNLNHPSRIKVDQYTEDGTFIATFDSGKDAALAVNGKTTSISRCLLGQRKTTRGFIFKYHSNGV